MALSNRRASTSIPHRKFHVFLSFRGEDTRKGFVKDLYEKLLERAIGTFRDDPELERGTYINEELMMAIEQSRFAIVVLSKNYASSTWCLLELAHIVRCMKESGRIMPIFYDVDPSDVRRQAGSFAQYFANHEKTYGKDGKKSENIHEWRAALTTLGKIAGWDSKDYRNDETTLIGKIVDEVWDKVHPTFKGLGPSKKSLRVYDKLKRIDSILDTQSNDIRLIGIWGMDVKGNTITAKLVLDRISDTFEVKSFLREIRKVSKNKSLVYLQAQLLEHMNGRYAPVSDVYTGKNMTRNCVRNRKVLRILDDVDQSDQLQILGGERDWYGQGSRIIFTSTNRDLLEEHGVELVEGLNKDEALQFSN